MFRYWDWNVRIVFTMLQDSRLNRSYHSTCVTSRAVLFISVACSLAMQLFTRQHKMAIRKSYRYCSNVEQPSICLTAYVLHGVAAVICADVFFLPWLQSSTRHAPLLLILGQFFTHSPRDTHFLALSMAWPHWLWRQKRERNHASPCSSNPR